jgi:hypothetical protein
MDRETHLEVALDLVKEVIGRGGEVPLKTVGLSMGPAVQSGDWLIVRKADPAEIIVGDVVVYQAGPRFVAHRVIRRCARAGRVWLTVKGDAQLAAEGEIAAADVLARAVAVSTGEPGGTRGARETVDLVGRRGRRIARWIARYSSAVDRLYRSVPFLHGVLGRSPDRRARPLARWTIRFLGGLNRAPIRLLLGSWVQTDIAAEPADGES